MLNNGEKTVYAWYARKILSKSKAVQYFCSQQKIPSSNLIC